MGSSKNLLFQSCLSTRSGKGQGIRTGQENYRRTRQEGCGDWGSTWSKWLRMDSGCTKVGMRMRHKQNKTKRNRVSCSLQLTRGRSREQSSATLGKHPCSPSAPPPCLTPPGRGISAISFLLLGLEGKTMSYRKCLWAPFPPKSLIPPASWWHLGALRSDSSSSLPVLIHV